MNRICLLVFVILLAPSAWGQSPEKYTRDFRQAGSANAFNAVFDSMIHTFHSGQLKFEDRHVDEIVAVAQGKSYADSLLPGVFGWARTMYANGRVKDGLTFFMKSADQYHNAGNKLGESISYYEIAIIQHKAENLNEAEKYYRLVIENGIDLLPYRIKINCFNGLAMILRERNHAARASMEFRKALGIATAQNDTAWIGILSGNIGSCHLALNNYDSGLWYYNRNLFFIRSTGEFENEIETYVNLGRIHRHKKQLALSKLYLDSALEIIETRKIKFNDFFNPMEQLHESYSMLFSDMGDYEKAYTHYVEFHRIANEKQQRINARSLKQLESVWQFQKNQNQIDLLTRINQQQRYISLAFGLLIFLLVGISAYALRRARRRKKINRQLSATNSELGRLNEVKDMLFSVISHDLRSPIANLKSTLDLLNKGNLKPEEMAMLAERLGAQLDVSGSALENILQWAKAQLHNMAVQPSAVRLSALVAGILVQLKFDIANKKIKVLNQVENDVVAFVDKDQLEVVIRNLITNAIKFTAADGSICITADHETKDLIRLTVSDTGIGMTAEQLNNLFKPNRYGSTQGTNNEKGTGIGLIIAREMVLANRGKIWAESELGKGTSFHVTMPAEEA